ncbi:MAG: hypothetical protein OK456_06155 [Thaumarchaeota archaeon]|nr:hypothetical protein [Nitrososphaerota archaeon]
MRPVFLLLVIIGVLLALAGLVFTLQGLGDVGPQTSFMYDSSTWQYQGVTTAFIGIVVILSGFFLGRRKADTGSK